VVSEAKSDPVIVVPIDYRAQERRVALNHDRAARETMVVPQNVLMEKDSRAQRLRINIED
jgi:hypothetical protein